MDLNETTENPGQNKDNEFIIDNYATAPEQIYIKLVITNSDDH